MAATRPAPARAGAPRARGAGSPRWPVRRSGRTCGEPRAAAQLTGEPPDPERDRRPAHDGAPDPGRPDPDDRPRASRRVVSIVGSARLVRGHRPGRRRAPARRGSRRRGRPGGIACRRFPPGGGRVRRWWRRGPAGRRGVRRVDVLRLGGGVIRWRFDPAGRSPRCRESRIGGIAATATSAGLVFGAVLARVGVLLGIDRPVRARGRPIPRRTAPLGLERIGVGLVVRRRAEGRSLATTVRRRLVGPRRRPRPGRSILGSLAGRSSGRRGPLAGPDARARRARPPYARLVASARCGSASHERRAEARRMGPPSRADPGPAIWSYAAWIARKRGKAASPAASG